MTDTISLTGTIATQLKSLRTPSGISIARFRLASSQRRFDRSRNEWVDGETNWYTVTAFRQLADNAGASLGVGDRVVVAGRLRIRQWEKDGKSGTAVEVDAESLGPDLLFGTTTFSRMQRPEASPSEPPQAQEPDSAADPAAATTPTPPGPGAEPPSAFPSAPPADPASASDWGAPRDDEQPF